MKYILLVFLVVVSCQQYTPKPKAFLNLDYKTTTYKLYKKNRCPFSFEVNSTSEIAFKKSCSFEVNYSKMKATLYISYIPVKKNIDSLINDAYQIPMNHVIKAEEILEHPYENNLKKVYGMLFSVTGNAASHKQFYVTDSVNHFINGSLYFYTKPNYDSLIPAIEYIEKDMIKFIESLDWN